MSFEVPQQNDSHQDHAPGTIKRLVRLLLDNELVQVTITLGTAGAGTPEAGRYTLPMICGGWEHSVQQPPVIKFTFWPYGGFKVDNTTAFTKLSELEAVV